MKRAVDLTVSVAGLLFLLPLLLVLLLLIWLQDYKNPFYIAPRMRAPGKTFEMVKLRSMVMNASSIGGTSTAGDDRRITWVGRVIRKCKFDEIPQLWNVLLGEMSLVGPRPQVARDASLYTEEENHLFDVRPGITDFASIVFADEGEVLAGSDNPDLRYNQLIRPWKSRLGLIYVRNHSIWIDLQLIMLTVVAAVSRTQALSRIQRILRSIDVDAQVVAVAGRTEPLQAFPPPGATEIETRW